MKKAILLGFLTFFILTFTVKAFAVAVPKITWCHVEPNGNQQTLELPQAALENAGHVSASGNPLHAGDHPGACVDTVPTVIPTVIPTITVVPTQGITPTVTPGVTATPSATPTVEPTTPPSNQGGPGDGRSDGGSSCPECTQAPKVENKSGQPIINQVGWK